MFDLFYENARKAWRARYPTGILCHKYRFIYFPVPKSGCSSLKKVIAELEGFPTNQNPHEIPFDMACGKDMSGFREYRSFTVVRNPWARLFSCYNDKVRANIRSPHIGATSGLASGLDRYNKILRMRLFYSDMSFEEFARTVSKIPDCLADEHFRSQYRMFFDPAGRKLADTVLKLENIDMELPRYFEDMGAPSKRIEAIQVSRAEKYKNYYSSNLRDLVEKRYRNDIHLLDYEF